MACCVSPMEMSSCGEFPYSARCMRFASRDTEWSQWLDESSANCESNGHTVCPWFNDTMPCNAQTLGLGSPTSDRPLERAAARGQASLEDLASHQFDYHSALALATRFFSAQRSGRPDLSPLSEVPAWLANGSFVSDGETVGLDLAGGYFDAGDYMKSTKTIGHAMTLLAWALLEFQEGFRAAGALNEALGALSWGCEYLLACHPNPDLLIVQVGDLGEHATWGPPPAFRPPSAPRVVFNLTAGQPMSDIATEVASALAAASLVFMAQPFDATQPPFNASQLLASARSLFALAHDHGPGPSNANNPTQRTDVFPQCDASECFYWTFASGVEDKLAWAATWMAAAELGGVDSAAGSVPSRYASLAAELIDTHLARRSESERASQSFSWDSKWPAVYVLASSRLPSAVASVSVAAAAYLNHWSSPDCSQPPCQRFTPGGLVMYQPWGALRYSTHVAWLALLHSKRQPVASAQPLLIFGRSQINYVLGANPSNRSFLTSFGANPPMRPHHRGASGLEGHCAFSRMSAQSNRYELAGAMVGGPYCGELGYEAYECDGYEDRREDAVRNEVAIDYNAGFVAAIAGLVATISPTASGSCCLWPREEELTTCQACHSFANSSNWLASHSTCLWPGNPYRYTWCPTLMPPPGPAPLPLALADEGINSSQWAPFSRPPVQVANYWSVLIFALEIAVAISSFIAALASLEKLFVLYTWWFYKSYPQYGSESHYRCDTRIDPCNPDGVPSVVVQCPVYNDREVCERVVDAACRLNYPRECLKVFVMDDSTDALTVQRIDERVAFWTTKGVDIRLCRRPNRKGFKAGNMLAFHHLVTAEYIAIFDSDFIPYPDFLLRTVPYLLDNPELGFVQGRWTYINQDESTFTRWVEITLNQHIKGEQFTRSACRTFLQFNGSGGIWRKACMDSAGGWNDETLVEDMDLSLRAYLIGWHALWLHDVRTPNELPSEYAPYRRQQYRWVYGPMQLYKRCVSFIWQSSLPFIHKLYLVVFFFSTRSTSLIANSLYFTFLLPVMVLVHFTEPEQGVNVPWWSALMLPMLTTFSVIVHTPRSVKYTVLYVLYENVLALHKAVASIEGMLGIEKGKRWTVTTKAGRIRRHGFMSSFGIFAARQAIRSKVFVREVLTGVYLICFGLYLSSEMRRTPESKNLFWFYGVYAIVQGSIYLLFGFSLVDYLSFEPDLPEAMRRPYRKALKAAVRPLSQRLYEKVAASPRAHKLTGMTQQARDRMSGVTRRINARLSAAKLQLPIHPTGNRERTRPVAPGLPWERVALEQGQGRSEKFVHVGAHDRIDSGSFVALPTCTLRATRTAPDDKDVASTSYCSNYAPGSEAAASPPPSPPSEGKLRSAAGDAAIRHAQANPRLASDGDGHCKDPPSSDPDGAWTCAPLLRPNMAPPTRRHVKSVLQTIPIPIHANAPCLSHLAALANEDDCSDADDMAFEAGEELRPSKQLSNGFAASETTLSIPRMRWRVFKRVEQFLLSAPLWVLNAVTVVGIWLCLSDLYGVELAENLVAFLLFALVLPLLLIWAFGSAATNTRAAWATLQGAVDDRQQLLHGVQLLLLAVAVALSFLVTLFTSSSRFSRWLRCQWTWLPEHGPPPWHGDWNVTRNLTEVVEEEVMNATNATRWQCGDHFFA